MWYIRKRKPTAPTDPPGRPGRGLLIAVFFVISLCLQAQDDTPAPAPEQVRVLFYNTRNYALTGDWAKTEESRQAVAEVIAAAAPDIAVLAEIADEEALDDLRERLKKKGRHYPVASLVKGFDKNRRLAVLARFNSVDMQHNTSANYLIKGRQFLVKRGFAHCVLRFANSYTLHIVGAHLKSKMYHPLGQTDMRRYEARQLHYMIADLLKKNQDSNILLLGDMNDSPDSSPINTLCSRRSRIQRQLFDLRPADDQNLFWTHYWDDDDSYTRIDYAFASHALLAEVVFEENRIFSSADSDWYLASDHRPLLIVLKPHDVTADEKTLKQFQRNFRTGKPAEMTAE